MKRLVIKPDGWICKYLECRPGFFVYNGRLCLMSGYGREAYNEGGEVFWGGVDTKQERDHLLVQPVEPVWEEI